MEMSPYTRSPRLWRPQRTMVMSSRETSEGWKRRNHTTSAVCGLKAGLGCAKVELNMNSPVEIMHWTVVAKLGGVSRLAKWILANEYLEHKIDRARSKSRERRTGT